MLKDKRFSGDFDFDLVEELDASKAETIAGGAFNHFYRMKVYANNEQGRRFTNKTGQTQTFDLFGLGSWSYGGGNPPVGANGKGYHSSGAIAPHLLSAALIMRRENGDYEMVGESGRQVTLEPGENIYLLMNDSRGNFGNNEGWVTFGAIW